MPPCEIQIKEWEDEGKFPFPVPWHHFSDLCTKQCGSCVSSRLNRLGLAKPTVKSIPVKDENTKDRKT